MDSATAESGADTKLYRRGFLGAMAAGMAWAGFGLRAGPAGAEEPQAWTDIAVEVSADRPVATAHRLHEQADGFHRLSITLSNKGKQPLTIERITVRIPLTGQLTNDLEMLYGGSCMGQTPLLRQNIGTLKHADFKGWATWDYYAYVFSADDIRGNVERVRQISPAANLVQIDAGWYAARGDYTGRTDLAGGMKGIADRIKAAGMIPGLWIDGFRANSTSEVCNAHPEYFLHDQEGQLIVEVRRTEGTDRDRVYVDYSHPGARAHIARRLRAIVQDWGFPYVKIDFMRFGLNQDIVRNKPAVKSIKAHDPTITSVERMRLGLQAMRDAAGPDTYLLGCSAVFGPCIGYVDGMRTGGDISPRYEAFPERSLANLGHFYLSGKVFNGDADYLVFREAADEDEKAGRHSLVLKHEGKDSFAQLCQKLQSR